MRINRKIFFDEIRPLFGKLDGSQVSGMNDSLDVWEMRYKRFPVQILAYCMATEFHETGKRMQPIREAFGKSTQSTIMRLDNAFKKGQMRYVKKPYWKKDAQGLSWFGRGRVQITHKRNYVKAARLLDVPIDKNPDLAMDPTISARILFSGCIDGWFTKWKLTDFINDDQTDFFNARKVVNPADKKTYKMIEGYSRAFLKALTEAEEVSRGTPDGEKDEPKRKKTFFDFLASLFKRK